MVCSVACHLANEITQLQQAWESSAHPGLCLLGLRKITRMIPI